MILALDISTTCIGYSIFNSEDGSLVELNCVKFNSKLTKFEKLEEFKKVTEYFKKFNIKYIAIEEPLKKFAGKFSSADTISLLNFFNGMISSYLYLEFGMEPFYFNVNNARSLAFGKKSSSNNQGLENQDADKGGNSKKHEVWNKVMQLEPLIQWRYGPKSRKLLDENYDMADSYVIGLAMLITIDRQNSVV
jgi:Holliday junction resolvasome RuvABC endonuclease subunit